jgi:phosphoglycerate dehydrogenase-like enzyme
MTNTFTIWTNSKLTGPAHAELEKGVGKHRLIVAGQKTGNLAAGGADPDLAEADIAFGQPDVEQVMSLPKLKWSHLSSAGYTRYDRADVRAALEKRGAALTNSSSVYDEPCSEHVLAFMLSAARQLPKSWMNQAGAKAWPTSEIRIQSRLLVGQTTLLLGFGAIGRRLAELLAPFHMKLMAVRQNVRGDESIPTFKVSELDRLLPQADHVVNILPSSPSTDGMFTAARFGLMKRDAIFYNIGRGTTVDQNAMIAALQSGKLATAYLDVTDPEPLPASNPLWQIPSCHISPHTGGGHDTEFFRLARHFLDNLKRFESGEKLKDRVI